MPLPILGPLLDIINKVVDRAIPDPVQKAALQVELAKLADQESAREHDEMMGQIGTNTEEAKNTNMFVSGWRPAIGWVCATATGYSYVLYPVTSWFARVIFHYGGDFPHLDINELMPLTMGMLGFGGLRTYEKIKGLPDSTVGQTQTPVPTMPLPAPVKKGLGSKVFGKSWPF